MQEQGDPGAAGGRGRLQQLAASEQRGRSISFDAKLSERNEEAWGEKSLGFQSILEENINSGKDSVKNGKVKSGEQTKEHQPRWALKIFRGAPKTIFFNISGAEFGVEQKFLSLYSSLTVEERFHIGHAKEDLVIFNKQSDFGMILVR